MKRLAWAAVLLVVAGCGPGLDVDTYPTEPDTELDCKTLFADVPQKVAGEDVIRVDGDNAVAWGAPPIILRCGVERPAIFDKGPQCEFIGGVDWIAEPTADGFLFTTIGRRFHVSVEVPNEHDPATDALIDLADVITKHDPSEKPCEGYDEE